jgi:NADH-quinone oxidoreductase subunit M
VFSFLGVVLVISGLLFLHHGSDRTFLADGTVAERSASMAELARVTFFSRVTPGWGLPVAKTSFVLLAVGFGVLGGFFPVHVWLPPVADETAKPALIVVIGSATRVGFLGLLRVAFLILPEACAWAQGTLVAVGSVGVLYCGLAALAERSLARQLAYAVTAQAGLGLASLATLSGPGVGAALVLLMAASASTILAAVVLEYIDARVGTLDVHRLGSLRAWAPLLALAFGLTWLGLAGSPGLFAFWGEVLGMMALLAHHATFFAISALGLVVLASAQLRAVRRVVFAEGAPQVRAGLKYHGDLDGPELLLFPTLILLVLLGLSPAPVLAIVQGAVRDAAIFLRAAN